MKILFSSSSLSSSFGGGGGDCDGDSDGDVIKRYLWDGLARSSLIWAWLTLV